MDERHGCLYYPRRLEAYFLDVDSNAFACAHKDPIKEAINLFGYDMIHRKEWSLLVSRINDAQIFKQRLFQLARSAGFRIEKQMVIKNEKPEYSYQFYNAYRPEQSLSNMTRQ